MQYFEVERDPEKVPLVTNKVVPVVLTFTTFHDHRPSIHWSFWLIGSFVFLTFFVGGIGLWKLHRAKEYSQYYTVGAGQEELIDLEVKVEQGILHGLIMKSRGGRNYSAYLGIPYAKPPLGELRFQPPVKGEGWEGVRPATNFGNTCIEKYRGDKDAKLEDQPDVTEGSEDCLYLNVYTPSESRRDRFPVMVYIHGGAGGAFGSGRQYGADYFMDEEVVLVTLEFRLGVLGNLNTHTNLASGNQALKDQLMALQWVQDNIQEFGGDKDTVTIFGNSFGGIQVVAHMLSPLGEGLYHRAIAQSGTLLYPGFFTENPLHDARRLGNRLGCTTDSDKNVTEEQQNVDLTKCLLNATSAELVLESLTFKNDFNYIFTMSNDLTSDTVFLPDGPLASLESGKIKSIPFITGIVDAEGLKDSLTVMTNPVTKSQFESNWTLIEVLTLYLEHTVQNKSRLKEMTLKIREFYLGQDETQNFTVLDDTNFRNFTNIYTDRLYLHPETTVLHNLRQKYEENQRGRKHRRASNAYLYYFSHKIMSSRTDALQEKYDGHAQYYGECHADELQFFFYFDAFPYISMDHPYANFSRMVVKMWVNFAKTGIPSGLNNDLDWEPVTDEHPYQFLNLNENPEMGESLLLPRIEFWNQFNTSELYM